MLGCDADSQLSIFCRSTEAILLVEKDIRSNFYKYFNLRKNWLSVNSLNCLVSIGLRRTNSIEGLRILPPQLLKKEARLDNELKEQLIILTIPTYRFWCQTEDASGTLVFSVDSLTYNLKDRRSLRSRKFSVSK
ncbi:hypothetical protein DS67_03895 [Mesotoga sp. SC_4PWA21]|nr:hypothetical protein DS67_03895 [Mesotoga sp. SC_4PWA21]